MDKNIVSFKPGCLGIPIHLWFEKDFLDGNWVCPGICLEFWKHLPKWQGVLVKWACLKVMFVNWDCMIFYLPPLPGNYETKRPNKNQHIPKGWQFQSNASCCMKKNTTRPYTRGNCTKSYRTETKVASLGEKALESLHKPWWKMTINLLSLEKWLQKKNQFRLCMS